MKLVLVLAVVIGAAVAAPKAGRTIEEDINKFIALVPLDKIAVAFEDFLENDPDFNLSVQFIRSNRFAANVADLDEEQTFIDFFKFLDNNDVPGYMWLNSIRAVLNLPPFPGTPPTGRHLRTSSVSTTKVTGRSIAPFLDEILTLLPAKEIIVLYNTLLDTSQSFRDLVSLSKSAEYRAVRDALTDSATYMRIDEENINHGIDIGAGLVRIVEYFVEQAGQP